jgi:hypothetical protein
VVVVVAASASCCNIHHAFENETGRDERSQTFSIIALPEPQTSHSDYRVFAISHYEKLP